MGSEVHPVLILLVALVAFASECSLERFDTGCMRSGYDRGFYLEGKWWCADRVDYETVTGKRVVIHSFKSTRKSVPSSLPE